MLDSGTQSTQETAIEMQAPEPSFSPTNLSVKDAVKQTAGAICYLIFDKGGFDEIMSGSGFGPLLSAAKPMMRRKAQASIESLTEEQSAFIVDQVHRLSVQFEELTGISSPYHYDNSEVSE